MTLKAELKGDRQLIIRRYIPAPPQAVFDAHTQAELAQKWMLGPPGCEMPICEYDARPGGSFRMGWTGEGFDPFEITGDYIALDPPHRIEHVERMHMPGFTTPDNHIVTEFTADGEGTQMLMTMTFDSEASRTAAMKTGMTDGMEQSYVRLQGML